MMTTAQPVKWLFLIGFLLFIGHGESILHAADADEISSQQDAIDVFDAIDDGVIEVKLIARNSERGRLILTNLTDDPVNIMVPDAFAGVPVLHQMGGMGGMGGGMGGGMMGGMGGGMQGMGGGAGMGGGRGGGRGGAGGGRGGAGGGGRFNVAPEQVTRIDVPLVCLDHGLREPSTSKPYEIRPIEDVVSDPATIEIIKAYTTGELPFGVTQAAIWHTNSQVSWDLLANKLTGTERNMHRAPYFSSEQLHAAIAIVNRAKEMTMGEVVEPRNWTPVSQRDGQSSEQLDVDPTEDVHESYDPEIDGGL